jgi:hypothetical protein
MWCDVCPPGHACPDAGDVTQIEKCAVNELVETNDMDLKFPLGDSQENTVLVANPFTEDVAEATWCGWFKMDNAGSQVFLFSYATKESASGNSLLFGLNKDNTGFPTVWRGASSISGTTAAKWFTDETPTWHHFCITVTGAAVEIYEDGVPLASLSGFDNAAALPTSETSMISLGQDQDGTDFDLAASTTSRSTNENFQGSMTRVDLWGEVLTAEHIAALYASGTHCGPEPTTPTAPLISWVEFASYAAGGAKQSKPSDLTLACGTGQPHVWAPTIAEVDAVMCADGVNQCTAATSTTVPSGTECVPCPKGIVCKEGAVYTCPDGTYSVGSSTVCHACPAGYDCERRNAAVQCETGEYSLAYQSVCTECTVLVL